MSKRTTVFDNNPKSRIPRSGFDLSHEKLFTADFQTLYPVMVKGCIPGDVMTLGQTAVVRFMPLVAPILTGVKMRTYDFFVPYRLLWDQWEEFITKGVSGTSALTLPLSDPNASSSPAAFVNKGSLWDYFGFPATIAPAPEACPVDFPRRAYFAIWNAFFRDETLQTEIDITDLDNYDMLKRNWSKDYFTSALPFQQRGTPPALPVIGTITGNSVFNFGHVSNDASKANVQVFYGGTDNRVQQNTSMSSPEQVQMMTNMDSMFSSSNTLNVTASLASADIADLRLAFKLQEWMEKNARGGARYTEFLLEQYNVFNGDARLQRPEYIGGASMPIIISEVLQTSSTDNEPTPQGTLAGHGLGVANGSTGSYRVTEFGLIMRLVCFTSEALYQQGINREWLRRTAVDYPFPVFAGLSEQEIFNAEIYTLNSTDDPDGSINFDVFGFTGRYNEERFVPSSVAGDMRDTFAYWHQSRIFSALPTLDSDFISASPRKDILAAPSEPAFVVRFGNQVEAFRPLPFMPVPVSIGGVQ